MRFSNWDVLLFPEDSRIPIQEFEVKCQALPQSFGKPSMRFDHFVSFADIEKRNPYRIGYWP